MLNSPRSDVLNEWLAQHCREIALRKHPTPPLRGIAHCFAVEQVTLSMIAVRFDGHVERMPRVSGTCLVALDRDRYRPGKCPGCVVSEHSTATQIRVVADDAIIAVHVRSFGRDRLICNSWRSTRAQMVTPDLFGREL